jgi:hypothetical protein
MDSLTRRRATLAVGGAVAAALAGCLGGDGTGGGVTIEIHQVGPTTAAPAWGGRENPAGAVELYSRLDRATERLESTHLAGVPSDRREDALTFARDTDFATAALVYVASEGPDTCFDEVAVGDLALDGETLTGRAEALDTSDPGDGCGDALTFPAALVRATADPRPTRARLTVRNGWGDESTVEATATE